MAGFSGVAVSNGKIYKRIRSSGVRRPTTDDPADRRHFGARREAAPCGRPAGGGARRSERRLTHRRPLLKVTN
jgi:hypothetical protein